MELIISLIAIILSFTSIIVSVVIYYQGERRERMQATLDAFNLLQEQVFDKLNQYKKNDIIQVCDGWKQLIQAPDENDLSPREAEEQERIYEEYRILSGYLARIEHFALGVNTGIYDANIADRAGTAYLIMLYRIKLRPLIEVKRKDGKDYHDEFRKLVERLEAIEKEG